MKALENIKDYLQSEARQSYRQLCEEWRAVKQLQAEVDAKEAALKQQILAETGGTERLEWGVKVARLEITGTIDYKALPEVQALDKNYLDQFRKPTRTEFRVTPY